jgi:hypothetical protein
MPSISDYVLDAALAKFDTEATHIYLCTAEPTTYAAAIGANNGTTQFGLGNKSLAAGDIAAPSDRTAGGRRVVVSALTGGTVTSNGVASHYAIVDQTNTRLLGTGALAATQTLTSGNTFSTASFEIGIPDPA